MKLLEFQYCFDMIYIHVLVNKIGYDWICTFCNEEIEDVCHLFCACRFTQMFWNEFLKDILHGKQLTKMIYFFERIIGRQIFTAKKCYNARSAETVGLRLIYEFNSTLKVFKK